MVRASDKIDDDMHGLAVIVNSDIFIVYVIFLIDIFDVCAKVGQANLQEVVAHDDAVHRNAADQGDVEQVYLHEGGRGGD